MKIKLLMVFTFLIYKNENNSIKNKNSSIFFCKTKTKKMYNGLKPEVCLNGESRLYNLFNKLHIMVLND